MAGIGLSDRRLFQAARYGGAALALAAIGVLMTTLWLRSHPQDVGSPEEGLRQTAGDTAALVQLYVRRIVGDAAMLAAIPSVRQLCEGSTEPLDLAAMKRIDERWSATASTPEKSPEQERILAVPESRLFTELADRRGS